MIMRKFALVLILLLSAAVSVHAQDEAIRVFEPMDRSLNYRFAYPMATHSVRTTNLFEPQSDTYPLVFGGLIAVEPNDSYIYNGPKLDSDHATQMRVLATPVEAAPESLGDLSGTLPLWPYDPGMVVTKQDITLGGQPAVRIDADDQQTTEIISYYDGVLYEIVIDPVILFMGFTLPEGTSYDPVYDQLLASWEFVPLVQS
jgi:hypothetical protein